MRRDRELLEWAYSSGESLPVLRFFLWRPPAISLGYLQSESDIDAEKCARDGIDIVRRPTGGRAILHSAEFTYSVTIPPWHPLAKMTILQTYNEISRALALGLRNLGIPAKLARGTGRINPKNPSCFSSTSRYELVVDGKKLVGSAQRRKNGGMYIRNDELIDHGLTGYPHSSTHSRPHIAHLPTEDNKVLPGTNRSTEKQPYRR